VKSSNSAPGSGFIGELRSLQDQLMFTGRIRNTDCENIAIAGMGGSGISGKIFRDLYDRRPVHLIDDYRIPSFIDSRTLFVAVSYSGNTEETLAATAAARRKGARIATISSGGKLCELGDENIVVPRSDLQPRAAIGYLLVPLLRSFGVAKRADLHRARNLVAELDRDNGECKKHAEAIFRSELIPYIYASPPFNSVAYRWKTQLNENGKVLAFSNHFPELSHNDTVALAETYGKERFYFMIIGSDDDVTNRRIGLTADLTKTDFHRVEPKGTGNVEKVFYSIHYGDYLSYHLGALRGKDPKDVHIIEALKRGLSYTRKRK
jgi:glucose/mannose-6-phosphate isomerase